MRTGSQITRISRHPKFVSYGHFTPASLTWYKLITFEKFKGETTRLHAFSVMSTATISKVWSLSVRAFGNDPPQLIPSPSLQLDLEERKGPFGSANS